MIWVWINAIVSGFIKFFAPPEFIIRKIDPNATCPACGASRGFIQAITADNVPLIQHTCLVCKAQWREKPVLEGPTAASSTTVLIAAQAPKE